MDDTYFSEEVSPYDEETVELIIKETLLILAANPEIDIRHLYGDVVREVYHQRYLDNNRTFYDEEYGFISGVCHMAYIIHTMKEKDA